MPDLRDVPKVMNRLIFGDYFSLVWDVFCKYEAVNYPASGKKAFGDAIRSEEYLQTLHAYGACEGKRLIRVIATRNEGNHIGSLRMMEKYGMHVNGHSGKEEYRGKAFISYECVIDL